MKKHLFVLLACLFVVMIGFGVTLPVLPFYVERLALAEGATRQSVVMHVGLLTGVYSLMQLIFAPVWGRWSDRIGRRPLILLGVAGYVVAQVMFGLSTSLWLLYAARIVGGILSSATLPVSAAYVVDMTTKEERSRGMAWLGTATSLGVVVGPAIGGLLSRRDWHLNWSIGHFESDSFSTPFFAAALLGLLTLLAAWRWLPESLPNSSAQRAIPGRDAIDDAKLDWRTLVRILSPLLALSLAGQFALTMFEGTFALFAQAKFDFGPADVGYVFVVCGLVMTVFQAGAVQLLAGRINEMVQIGAGFALMGAGIALLATAQSKLFIFAFVALLALGMALIAPNLSALVSARGSERKAGAALGIQNAANSLGQAGGPLVGGVLFIWQINAPYFFGGALLLGLALLIAWKAIANQRAVRLA
ncbi:MAG: MFS transporter [Gemmatimonadaceae bacterium]|nr:MFS transporter [Gemmatimonadaceae bacterium]